MTKKNYLCPTCGRRCIGFNTLGRCENKRYQPGYVRPKSTGSYWNTRDCGQTCFPAPRVPQEST